MALSQEFRQALSIYKIERKFGTLWEGRARLCRALRELLHVKCREAFPGISHHSLWRLRDGGLGLIINRGEVRDLGTPAIHLRFMKQYEEMRVLEAAAVDRLWIAPVTSHLPLGFESCGNGDAGIPEPASAAIMRKLRRIYRLRFGGSLLYAYPARERAIPLGTLKMFLGRPTVERWQFPGRERSRTPVDIV